MCICRGSRCVYVEMTIVYWVQVCICKHVYWMQMWICRGDRCVGTGVYMYG